LTLGTHAGTVLESWASERLLDLMDLNGGIRDLFLELEVGEHTLVEHTLGRAALEELVVRVLQALPVQPELVQAVLVDVVEHRDRASGDAAALLETVCGVALRVLFALHEVVVVGPAAGANEVGGRLQRGARGTHFGYLRHVRRQRRSVDTLVVLERGLSGHYGDPIGRMRFDGVHCQVMTHPRWDKPQWLCAAVKHRHSHVYASRVDI